MKKNTQVFAIFLSTFFILSGHCFAEVDYSHAAIGFELNRYQDDFGYGVNATTPSFLDNTMAARVSVTLAHFSRYSDASGGSQWLAYPIMKIGVLGGSIAKDFLRMYGYGGALVIFPNKDFSSDGVVVGGFGTLGFEFISGHSLNYFIELGATASGSKADKLAGKPLYANGFLATVGFRYYL